MPFVIGLEAPSGAAVDFVVVFAVVLLGPVIVERAGIPGIIGLLIGGFVIGPHGLGVISSGNQTVPELGQLGLLYLMFVAGLELDLGVLAANRRAAGTFGVLTFALPFVAGLAVGAGLGWELAAALLLGSLLASHTLITYPTFREAGRGANRAVATAVGATVLTDTLALVVLAGVSGTETGSGSTVVVLGEILLGLVVMAVVGLTVLPRLAMWALRAWGGDRAARYMVAVVSFLAMAVLAETFGIEGIVGAFFAGLALNRLVPNEGPSMERIEFFGSAVFIPVFLVSVGLLLDPSVMFRPSTLGIAALIVVACLGGKALAALVVAPAAALHRPRGGGAVRTDHAPDRGHAGRHARRLRHRAVRHVGGQRRAGADPREHRRVDGARQALRGGPARPRPGRRGTGAPRAAGDPPRRPLGRGHRAGGPARPARQRCGRRARGAPGGRGRARRGRGAGAGAAAVPGHARRGRAPDRRLGAAQGRGAGRAEHRAVAGGGGGAGGRRHRVLGGRVRAHGAGAGGPRLRRAAAPGQPGHAARRRRAAAPGRVPRPRSPAGLRVRDGGDDGDGGAGAGTEVVVRALSSWGAAAGLVAPREGSLLAVVTVADSPRTVA